MPILSRLKCGTRYGSCLASSPDTFRAQWNMFKLSRTMDKPSVLEHFRRGASYYAKRKPPKLRGVMIRVSMMWLATFFFLWLGFRSFMFSRPGLIIFTSVMAPGTVLGIIQIVNRWRKYGPPE